MFSREECLPVAGLAESLDETLRAEEDVVLVAGLHLKGAVSLPLDARHLLVVEESVRAALQMLAAALRVEIKLKLSTSTGNTSFGETLHWKSSVFRNCPIKSQHPYVNQLHRTICR